MRIVCLLLYFFCLFETANAQNKMLLDSLKTVYQTTKHDTTKILTLTAIAFEYRNNKPDTCIAIAEKALQMSEKIGFEKGKAWAMSRIGIGNHILSKYIDALAYYQKALLIFEKIQEKKGMSSSFNNMASIYETIGNYPLSLEYDQKSLKIDEETGDKEGFSSSLNNIGLIYSVQGNYSLALEYLYRSLKIKEEIGDKDGITYSLNNIGDVYYKQNNFPLALEYYQKSLKTKEKIKDVENAGDILANIGVIYTEQGYYKLALEYQQRSLKIHQEIGNKLRTAYSINNIAIIYQKQKDYAKSIEYAQKSLQTAQEVKALKELSDASKTLFETYKLKGDYTKALEYHELYKQTNDSIFNADNSKKIANLEAIADIEKKTKEIEILNKNQEILKKDSEFKLTIIYVIVVFSVVVMFVSYFLFISRKRNIKAKNVAKELSKKIELQRQAISHQADELSITLQTVEKQRDNIISSINYALRIQNAIIPKEQEIQKYFPESFVLFRPKDIVSGDFYWFADKITDTGNKKIIVVADCTGHGVSGAFMTMIGNNMLNHIVHDLEITQPNEILNLMTPLLEKTLLHSEGKVKDGMDISIISIHPKGFQNPSGVTIEYSGAMNPLYYVENQEFKEIKADKVPIGGKQKEGFSYQLFQLSVNSNQLEDKKLITDYSLLITDNCTLYLCTDGFQDQFGGTENRKFMVSKFKKLLLEISDKPITKQKEILETTISNWILAGNETQTDDICVLGVRL
jgi:tetratricopeptide (TPR) repeat protein